MAANLAEAALTGTAGRATPTLTAHFHAMVARALSAAGDAPAAQRSLGEAVRVFERRHPDDDPEWITYFDDIELSAEFAHCNRDLGRAADAIKYATTALAGAGASARSDFFVTMVLADGQLGAGNVEEACATVGQALPLAGQLKSARCVRYVRDFRRRLARSFVCSSKLRSSALRSDRGRGRAGQPGGGTPGMERGVARAVTGARHAVVVPHVKMPAKAV